MKYWQRNRIRAIVSPRGLAAALAWKGGVRNSAVQLVRINSERLQQLSTSVEAVVQKLSMYFTRCCDIQYGNISNEDETVLKVALHSGYNVAKFHVTFPTESKRAHVELVEANQQMDDRSRDVDSQPSDPVTEDDETQPPNSMTLDDETQPPDSMAQDATSLSWSQQSAPESPSQGPNTPIDFGMLEDDYSSMQTSQSSESESLPPPAQRSTASLEESAAMSIDIAPDTLPSGDNYSLPSSDAATAGSHEPSGSDTSESLAACDVESSGAEAERENAAQEISPRQHDFAAEPVETALVVDTDMDRAIESDTESADTDDEWVAPRLSYSPTGDDGARHFSRVTIVNASSIDYNSLAPRPARKPRGLASAAQSASVAPRNDALAVAVRYAAHLVQTNEVAIRSARQAAPEYTLAREMPMKTRSQGWGRRPAHGKTYGATYLREFQREVAQMYNAGVRQSTAKMGPSQMREELKRNNPDRFSIPSFLELRSAITTLGNKSRATQGGEVPLPDHNAPIGATSKRGRKSALSNELISFIEHLVDQQSDIKPRAALQLVKEHFTTLPEEATDSRITSKVSSTKSARKKKALRL